MDISVAAIVWRKLVVISCMCVVFLTALGKTTCIGTFLGLKVIMKASMPSRLIFMGDELVQSAGILLAEDCS